MAGTEGVFEASARLRALLGARGAAWTAEDGRRGARTLWECPAGDCAFYEDATNGYTRLEVRHGGWGVLSMESDMRPPELFVTPERAVEATLGAAPPGREAELVRAVEDVLRFSSDTVWAGEGETLVDRMVRIGVYGPDVYEGARPWEERR